MTDSSIISAAKKAKAGSFQAMNLDRDILSGLNRMGYKTPTPVQRKALPIALSGNDIVCMARTGSGKTCVFLLPMVQKLKTHKTNDGLRGLVLSPTRELALQTFRFAKDMAKFTDLRVVSIIGGDPIEAQFEALASRPDIIIATPGRLMHHLREISTFKLKSVEYLVFDEADRLFEMGFAEQLNEIVRECPKERQTLLFSATMPKQLVQFSRAGLRDPQLIRLDTDTKMSDELRLGFFSVRSNEKVAALLYLVRKVIPSDQLTIVFTATRHHSEFLHSILERLFVHGDAHSVIFCSCTQQLVGVTSAVVYGSMDQDARTDNLKRFRDGTVQYLIVTDLAARGIDVPLLNNVINFHFPPIPKLFVHRCGRAARQGRIGHAFSLVEPEELAFMVDVHSFLGRKVSIANLQLLDSVVESADSAAAADVEAYTLSTMQPTMVHSGIFPQDVLDQQNEFLRRAVDADDSLAVLLRVSENGMRQYRRTRTEASHEGVKLAKKLVKANAIRTIHPLIIGSDPGRCSSEVVEKAKYVRMLQTFRPQQTILETGVGTGSSSARAKGKGIAGSVTAIDDPTIARQEGKGVQVMKALRVANAAALERNHKSLSQEEVADLRANQQRLLHSLLNKSISTTCDDAPNVVVTRLHVHDDDDSSSNNDDDHGNNDSDIDEQYPDEFDGDDQSLANVSAEVGLKTRHPADDASVFSMDSTGSTVRQAPRVSPRARKNLRKKGITGSQLSQYLQSQSSHHRDDAMQTDHAVVTDMHFDTSATTSNSNNTGRGKKRKQSFRDERHYMAYGSDDQQQTFAEESMQPMAGLRSSEAQSARMLESALLDVAPDDALELNRKRKILRWDAKKRKFVKQTLEEMSSSRSQRLRTESGAPGAGSKNKKGEMYEKWKKRSRMEVGGLVDEADDRSDRLVRPNFKANTHVRDEIRSTDDVKRLRKKREDQQLKNMSKDKRRQVEAGNRKKQQKLNALRQNTKASLNARNRRSKVIVRF